ncbi:hypothetical protein [Brevibacillus laterosporus]|uniref:hypothetical protein n=1 Tax=Brevibacillus laterosporus TaxID=1465 RepID=UPI000CE3DA52|nr:hypothetical protein [Brevibacillus laterosporus]MED1663385.1 hypothetical protein [Brevibacillus laterosporus]MED1668655.1 hypothetical protein [Brevibacillus laterosporus]MED1717444.1 hypothetical protein [Brevibacillus laterosporus]PPA90039.1 hypothetical protein C4A76_00815 [Brevibacillus laterosporus]
MKQNSRYRHVSINGKMASPAFAAEKNRPLNENFMGRTMLFNMRLHTYLKVSHINGSEAG